jgi:FKBP-type peptidyl-prolyl cis-trans isomerase 2
MSQAKNGDKVRVHYTGKFDNGEVFDSSRERQPLEFELGKSQVIPGFEKAIEGLEVGQKKEFSLPPEEAYGTVRKELISVFPKKDFPENINLEVGRQLQVPQPDGRKLNVMITKIENEEVTLDANHPLAGKTLNFDIELVEIL